MNENNVVPLWLWINGFHHDVPRTMYQIQQKQYARILRSIRIIFFALLTTTAQRWCMLSLLWCLCRCCCGRCHCCRRRRYIAIVTIATAIAATFVWIISSWHRVSHCTSPCVSVGLSVFIFVTLFRNKTKPKRLSSRWNFAIPFVFRVNFFSYALLHCTSLITWIGQFT